MSLLVLSTKEIYIRVGSPSDSDLDFKWTIYLPENNVAVDSTCVSPLLPKTYPQRLLVNVLNSP
jgi:hypothetical protein